MQTPTDATIPSNNQPFQPVSNPGSDDTSGLEQKYQKSNPTKGEELNEFTNNTDRDEDYEQTESTINRTDSGFPRDDSNIGDNPIYPQSDEVIASNMDDGTADPHSDRSKEDRGEDNPQDIDITDEVVRKEIIDDESLDNERLGDESLADGRDRGLDSEINIDDQGGGDGESDSDEEDDSHSDTNNKADRDIDFDDDHEVVTSIGI